jgi:hypothetical protein
MMHQRPVERVFKLMVVALFAMVFVNCGAPYRYSTKDVRSIDGSSSFRAMSTEVIDAEVVPKDAKYLAQIREAVHDHLVRTGVVAADFPLMAAPTSVQELDEVLATARAHGANQVVFVRLHGASAESVCTPFTTFGWILGVLPAIILDSVPLHKHGAFGAFEVLVVDTATREMLGRSIRVASFGKKVSAWTCSGHAVMLDMMKRAVQHSLEDVAVQAKSGWPRRMSGELADWILTGRTIRHEQGRLQGPGWSLAVPEWEPGDDSSTLKGPDGLTLKVVVAPASGGDKSYLRRYSAGVTMVSEDYTLRNVRTLEGERYPSLELESTIEGNTQLSRVTTTGGMAVVTMCIGSQDVIDAHRSECQRIFDGLTWTDELISDGRRKD